MADPLVAHAEIRLRVQPRSSRNEISGEREGALVVRVTAAPVEGTANEAVRALLAKKLGIAKGRVEVVRGKRGRDKVVRVEGMSAEEARAALLR